LQQPIGIFDSGLGGLTVLKEVMDMLPNESIVYFGDSGRAPYGTKSEEVIVKYTFQDINFLQSNDVKIVVMGCNTASACSLEEVLKKIDIPIVDVVGPGAAAAAKQTRNGKIGVIGTAATISSGVYEKAIKKINPEIEVFGKECSMFVPLVEEGWWDDSIAYSICERYLKQLKDDGVDTLILGCTHYPLLKNTIGQVMGSDVLLVNSAIEVAKAVKNTLDELKLNYNGEHKPEYKFFTSDSVEKFKTLGSTFLGREIENVKSADIERY